MRHRLLAFALAAGLPIACSQAPAKKGTVVAQGGGVTITAEELKARLDEQAPMIRASYASLERRKQFLENMLRFELLARAAEKEGLANDPDVRFAAKRAMVSKYYQRFFASPAASQAVPDADVKAYYDEHHDEFHRPARVHVAQILVAAPAGSPARAKKAAQAKKMLAKLLEDEKKSPGLFTTTARQSSDDAATKAMGGDLGLRSHDELEKSHGKAFADAVFALADNQTSKEVVESPQGFHLLRVLGRQPALDRTLDEAKPQITSRLASQRKAKEFDDFVKKLRDDAKVQIDEAALEKVVVAGVPGAPAAPPAVGAPHATAPAAPPPTPAKR